MTCMRVRMDVRVGKYEHNLMEFNLKTVTIIVDGHFEIIAFQKLKSL